MSNEEKRKRNRAVYPICQLCQQPAHYRDFIFRHRGLTADTIKICCKPCVGQFNTLPEEKQREFIRLACVVTYGPEQYIYQIVNPETRVPFYVGRSKNAAKRFKQHMRELTRPNDTSMFLPEEKLYSSHDMMRDLMARGLTPGLVIIERVTPGAAAVEREIRHILNGIQRAWPLLNMEAYKPEVQEMARAALDFLTVPYTDELQASFQPFQHSPQIPLIRYVYS